LLLAEEVLGLGVLHGLGPAGLLVVDCIAFTTCSRGYIVPERWLVNQVFTDLILLSINFT